MVYDGTLTKPLDEVGPSVLTWPYSVDDDAAKELPFFRVGPKGFVDDKKSMYYGMRNPETRIEWIAALYYITLTALVAVNQQTLPNVDVDASLQQRCGIGVRRMRSHGITLQDIYGKIFLTMPDPFAMVWSSFAWKAFDETPTRDSKRGLAPLFFAVRYESMKCFKALFHDRRLKRFAEVEKLTVEALLSEEFPQGTPKKSSKTDQNIHIDCDDMWSMLGMQ
jgi:hypothetical protein